MQLDVWNLVRVRSKPLDSSILKQAASTRVFFFFLDMEFPILVCGVLFFMFLYTSDPSPSVLWSWFDRSAHDMNLFLFTILQHD